jgi:2-oxopent-4-enoate/cis-2-oxohex-4-enoate hydratase
MNELVERGLAAHLKRFAAVVLEGRRLGWKVAFNVRPIQERLGLSGSLVAGLTRATVHDAEVAYSLAGAANPALEAEVAVWLDRDVSPDDSEATAAAAIREWAPAIEIVDYDRPFDQLDVILEEGVFHRAVVFGARVTAPAGADLSGHVVTVQYGGQTVCRVDAREATGHAPTVLLHLARLLSPYGAGLAASDVVILGTMSPLTIARPSETFAVSIDGIGTVSVSLEQ